MAPLKLTRDFLLKLLDDLLELLIVDIIALPLRYFVKLKLYTELHLSNLL